MDTQSLIVVVCLYIFNHLVVTLIRAQIRSNQMHDYSYGPNKTGEFKRGLRRRAFKSMTFLLAVILTVMEVWGYFVVIA